jgi:iron complex outermembrane receptor protein
MSDVRVWLGVLSTIWCLGAFGQIEELVVREARSAAQNFETVGAASTVAGETVEFSRADHAHELMMRFPGVWISRGSGQEHLTAIRSPVLTGAGACGAYLFLENGVPVRPAGFCNVNELFEVFTEQAAAIEVVRGPASGIYGGNALHGVVNSLAPEPTGEPELSVGLEAGRWDFYRARIATGGRAGAHRMFVGVDAVDADAYREASGHRQQKVTIGHGLTLGEWEVTNTVSGTNLDQETAGFVLGFKAYKDSDARKSNPNPEAFRDAWALRLTSEWSRALGEDRALMVTPFMRRSKMQFLQHFLPGQPREKNGQASGGVLVRMLTSGPHLDWTVGGHMELMRGFLKEVQNAPTQGSPFLMETRPEGVHYDYDVSSLLTALFYDLEWRPLERLSVVHSLRAERLAYDYDNDALDGNTRDDGTQCGFGGCLYTRPSDRDDDFFEPAGRIGIRYALTDAWAIYGLGGLGFRAPQATELYRLQSGQSVADLDAERLKSVEIGLKGVAHLLDVSVSVFAQHKRDQIIRDANGFYVSGGRTRAYGVESELVFRPFDRHEFRMAWTYARHEYDFDRLLAGGTQITKGDDVDTAPHFQGSAHWRVLPTERSMVELEVWQLGEHYLNPENTARYDGHTVVNLRAAWTPLPKWRFSARIMNLLNAEYADRADFAFGEYRYFPAMPIHYFFVVEFRE